MYKIRPIQVKDLLINFGLIVELIEF